MMEYAMAQKFAIDGCLFITCVKVASVANIVFVIL